MKRKVTSLLCVVLLAINCMALKAQTQHTIDNVNELVELRIGINTGAAFTYKGNSVPAFGEGIHFKLTADLDLSSVCGASVGSGTSWTPIGNDLNSFKGHFHGGGHTISNLYINAPTSEYQGLFGYVYDGSIDSLNLVNTNVTGEDYVGGVCGRTVNSTISYCSNNGSVSGKWFVGGVCGSNNDSSTISHCLNSGSVSGSKNVGGMSGDNYSNCAITYCLNSGSINGTGDYVGGVCGDNNSNCTIKYCLNSGSVSGSSNVGGVIGRNNSSTINYCYYDKQLCIVGGINGSDKLHQAEGKRTT